MTAAIIDERLENLETRASRSENDITDIYSMVGEVQKTLKDHTKRLGRLETKVDKLDTKVDQLGGTVNELSGTVNEIGSKLDQVLERLPS